MHHTQKVSSSATRYQSFREPHLSTWMPGTSSSSLHSDFHIASLLQVIGHPLLRGFEIKAISSLRGGGSILLRINFQRNCMVRTSISVCMRGMSSNILQLFCVDVVLHNFGHANPQNSSDVSIYRWGGVNEQTITKSQKIFYRSDREDEPFLCIAPQPVPRRSKVNMQKMKEKAAAASNAKREPAPLSLM